MRRHNYRLWKYAIFSMMLIVTLMAIGYSALSQALNVTSTSTVQQALDWMIKFSGTYNAVPLSTSPSSVSCASPTITDNTATLNTIHLSAAGDGCKYELQVSNTGDIGGLLSAATTVVNTNTSGYTCSQVSSGKVISCTKSGDDSEILIFPSSNSAITASTLGSSTASSIATSYVDPLINTNLSAGTSTNVYLYVFLRGTPASTTFSGLSFTTTISYAQN